MTFDEIGQSVSQKATSGSNGHDQSAPEQKDRIESEITPEKRSELEHILSIVDAELCQEYLLSISGDNYSNDTVEEYARYLKDYNDFLVENDSALLKAGARYIRKFMKNEANRGVRKGGAQIILSAIKNLYRYLAIEGYDHSVSYWELDSIKISSFNFRPPIQRTAPTRQEITEVMDAAKNCRNKIMIHTAVATGLRNSDIRECTIPNTDLKGGFIYIPDPKGGESYRIPLVDKTRHLLRYWINKKRSGWVDNPDNPYIFPSKRGKYLKSNSSFVRIVHDAAKEAGVNEVIGTTADGRSRYKIKPHTLRHAYVTMLDKSDVPEESQVVAVNHSDPSVTETYRHKEKEHHDKIKQRFDPPGEL